MSARPYIGGQAVIEGVMMRSPTGLAVAVRRPDGSLAIKEGPVRTNDVWKKWPFLRGVHTLVESMSLGYGALQFAAEQQLTDEEAQAESSAGGSGGGVGARAAMVLSMALAIGLFIALPQALTWGLVRAAGLELGVQDFAFHALTGAFKLLVLTTYLTVIGRVQEIQRVFQYHGAEHKTIYAYEAGLPLTVANVKAQSTLHPRCGTTFLVVVVLLSIVIGSTVTPFVLPHAEGLVGQLQTLALRVSLLPVIAGFSYELQRVSARYFATGPLRFVNYPGFLFQKITTREPDERQIEVAIAAMQSAVWRERSAANGPSEERVEHFASLDAVQARFGEAAE